MLKKISVVLLSFILAIGLAGCVGSNSNAIVPDKEVIPIPESLFPQGVTVEQEDSRGYFETTQPLDELIQFYTEEFESLDVKVEGTKTEEDFYEEGILLKEEGIEDAIVWGIVGTKGEEKTPYSVVIAHQDGTYGVSIGVGYRGKIMAQGMGVDLSATEETEKETEKEEA